MKKLFIAVAVVGLAISFSSCAKDYTCECVSTLDGVEIGTTEMTAEFSKSSDAENWCSGTSTSSTVLGITSGTECELK